MSRRSLLVKAKVRIGHLCMNAGLGLETKVVSENVRKRQVFQVVANNARICQENLFMLKHIEAGRQAAGVTGAHYHAHIFERLVQNAQQAAMINLAKVFGENKRSLSLKYLDKKIGLLPSSLEVTPPVQEKIDSLKEWRNRLLAHSGTDQLEENIPAEFPLTQNDLAEILDHVLKSINYYWQAHCPEVPPTVPAQFEGCIDTRWKPMKEAVEIILGTKIAVSRGEPFG